MSKKEAVDIDTKNDEELKDEIENQDEKTLENETLEDEIVLDELDDEEEEENDEEEEKLKQELEKLRKENKTLKIQKAKIKSKKDTVKDTDNLSTTDLYALVTNKVHEDDIREVVDFARFKGISVKEALKTPTIKTMLSANEEYRQTAQATNTKRARGGAREVSEETLLKNAQKGELPENDNDIQRLVDARLK